jgi:hypothetical protein
LAALAEPEVHLVEALSKIKIKAGTYLNHNIVLGAGYYT